MLVQHSSGLASDRCPVCKMCEMGSPNPSSSPMHLDMLTVGMYVDHWLHMRTGLASLTENGLLSVLTK